MSSICPYCKEINTEWSKNVSELHTHYNTILQSLIHDHNLHTDTLKSGFKTSIDTLSEIRNVITLTHTDKEPNNTKLIEEIRQPLQERITYLEECVRKKNDEIDRLTSKNKVLEIQLTDTKKSKETLEHGITRLEKMYDQLTENHTKERENQIRVIEKYKSYYKKVIDDLLSENESLRTENRDLRHRHQGS